MNRKVYDASMLVALGLVAAGAGLQWGVPVGLMVGGGMLAAITVFSLYITGGR